MALLQNSQATVTNIKENVKKPAVLRDRFVIGKSECYFETAGYLTGKLDAAAIKRMFLNPNTIVCSRFRGTANACPIQNGN